MKPLAIAFLLLTFASSAYSQEQAGPLDRWEARAERMEQAIERNSGEAKRWNDFLARWEARFEKWDGSKLLAIFQPLWLIVVGAYRLASLALYALIAVCVARSIREVSEAVVAWRPTPK